MTNCPNCGAPFERLNDQCSYCGTPYQNKITQSERKSGDGCKGCIYRKRFGQETGFCDYFGVTGELRGCPAGKGCTHYTKTSRGKRLRKYLAEF